MKRALIICIGNDLVADDGVGKVVYERLKESGVGENVRLVYLGLGGIELIEEMAGEELLIVVDSVQLGGETGTIHQLGWEQLPPTAPRPVSGHGIGIREAIGVADKLYPERCPGITYLIGIEGSCFTELGADLSEEVRRSVPEVVKKVQALVQTVCGGPKLALL